MQKADFPATLTDADADALADLIDQLIDNGSQHITLETGEQTTIRTVQSTDCSGKPGPCAVPNLGPSDSDS